MHVHIQSQGQAQVRRQACTQLPCLSARPILGRVSQEPALRRAPRREWRRGAAHRPPVSAGKAVTVGGAAGPAAEVPPVRPSVHPPAAAGLRRGGGACAAGRSPGARGRGPGRSAEPGGGRRPRRLAAHAGRSALPRGGFPLTFPGPRPRLPAPPRPSPARRGPQSNFPGGAPCGRGRWAGRPGPGHVRRGPSSSRVHRGLRGRGRLEPRSRAPGLRGARPGRGRGRRRGRAVDRSPDSPSPDWTR